VGEKQAEPLIDPDTSKILGVERKISNSVSAFFYKKSVGLEEENEIRTTALVVIDRLECVFLLQHSSSISREDDVP
jgi:hypothetical protein